MPPTIRQPFLNSARHHGAVVVHGHTIADSPVVRFNRIGIDTGAGLERLSQVLQGVIPDTFRIDRSGTVLECVPGFKKLAIRATPGGGTYEEPIAPDRREEVLKRAEEMVAYARGLGAEVQFSPEDASRSDPTFLHQVLRVVVRAGAPGGGDRRGHRPLQRSADPRKGQPWPGCPDDRHRDGGNGPRVDCEGLRQYWDDQHWPAHCDTRRRRPLLPSRRSRQNLSAG